MQKDDIRASVGICIFCSSHFFIIWFSTIAGTSVTLALAGLALAEDDIRASVGICIFCSSNFLIIWFSTDAGTSVTLALAGGLIRQEYHPTRGVALSSGN